MSNFLFQDGAMSSLKELFLVLLCFLIFVVLALRWRSSSSNTPKNRPPSPPSLPIIGNLHQIGSSPQHSLKSLAQKYGPLILLHFGRKPVLIVSSADAAREVLKTHDLAFADRPKTYFASRLLYQFRDMTFAPYGEYWRQARSICVIQLLSNRRVEEFGSIREEEIKLMMEKIRESCASGSVINFDKLFAALTNDVVCMVTTGRKYSVDEGGSKFKELFAAELHLLGAFNIGDYVPWLAWVNHINGMEAKVNQVAKDLDQYLDGIFEEEMNRRKSENSNRDESICQKNFAGVLLEIQRSNTTGVAMDRDCIKAVISDMIIGATDTTYTVLQWAMTELLRHKNFMTRLKEEVRGVVGCKSRITEEDLEKMHFLKAVIKETLRSHPPVPLLVPRAARMDVNLMGYDIAEGTQVIINAWAIARDPSLWEEAEEFRPERFLNSSVDFKGQHFEFIPFGSGRRSCPGSAFGIGIAELALANLMYNFDFALPSGVRAEDLDLSELPGIIALKKVPLLAVANPC